jgi:hypothetical protein
MIEMILYRIAMILRNERGGNVWIPNKHQIYQYLVSK